MYPRGQLSLRQCSFLQQNMPCHLTAIAGTIILVPWHPCQVTATHMKILYELINLSLYNLLNSWSDMATWQGTSSIVPVRVTRVTCLTGIFISVRWYVYIESYLWCQCESLLGYKLLSLYIEGILPKGSYLPCVSVAIYRGYPAKRVLSAMRKHGG